MKSTEIIRKLDNLGQIFIPKEIKDNFNISTKDQLEIFKRENKIFFRNINHVVNFVEK